MRLAIIPAITCILLAAPIGAQADQQAVDALIGQLRPRSTTAPIVQRGLPKPGAPVQPTMVQPTMVQPGTVQPTVVQPVSSSQTVTMPRPTTPAATGSAPRTTDRPSADMDILFVTGSAELTPSAARKLQDLGAALTHESMGQSRFLIEGHTDTVGDTAMNQTLSERRAATVAAFLIANFRLPAERLSIRGAGEAQLLVPTPDNVAEPRNRRVHIVNLDG